MFPTSLSAESIVSYIINTALMVPGIVFAFTFKGFIQAFVSKKLGDPTPENQGRLTMNPLAHINWIGLLCMVLFGFGFGKPMPTSPVYYQNYKRDKVIYCLSGPLSLITLSFVLQGIAVPFSLASVLRNESAYGILSIICLIFMYGSLYSIVLGYFYLLPLPGLDGYNMITALTPARFNQTLFKIERYSTFIFLGFIFLMRFTNLGTIIFYPAYKLHDLYTAFWSMVFTPVFSSL